jgi:hypothetical protein
MNQNDLNWVRLAACIVDKTPEEVIDKVKS